LIVTETLLADMVFLHRLIHCATGFSRMSTILKAALFSVSLDFGKPFVDFIRFKIIN